MLERAHMRGCRKFYEDDEVREDDPHFDPDRVFDEDAEEFYRQSYEEKKIHLEELEGEIHALSEDDTLYA